MYQYKGYSYEPWEDIEPEENCKIFHDVYATNGDVKVSSRSMPLSPYSSPSEEVFRMWIDCGQPTSEQMGLRGNAHIDDIVRYYNKWLDDKIDEAILGVSHVSE